MAAGLRITSGTLPKSWSLLNENFIAEKPETIHKIVAARAEFEPNPIAFDFAMLNLAERFGAISLGHAR